VLAAISQIQLVKIDPTIQRNRDCSRILTAVDQFTRECVGLEADRCMTGMKVVPALEKARGEREAVCRKASRWITGASSAVPPWRRG
jgi:hypothetical protein